jgi:RNA polymerase subunit RPABC4/transcription elongation factor Spt4
VGDLLETLTRCPHCRAAVRPGAPWCTLCHADLRAAPAPAPAPAFDPLTAPAPELGLPAAHTPPAPTPPASTTGPASPTGPGGAEACWPCTRCGAAVPLAVDACPSCGAGFLAGLREAEAPLLELPGVGDLTRRSRGTRMLLAFGVVLLVVALTALVGLLLG